jgi:putative ABC transport system permease protein
MKILLKYNIRNILDKKFRTMLIILSISITSGLTYASNEATAKIIEMTTESFKDQTGEAKILIAPDADSTEQFFDISERISKDDRVSFMYGANFSVGYYQEQEAFYRVNIMGIDIEEFSSFNPITFKERSDSKFTGHKLIISEEYAKGHGISIDDSIEIEVNHGLEIFQVYGICYRDNYFIENSGIYNVIVPIDTVISLNHANNKYNRIYIGLKENIDENVMIADIQQVYQEQNVIQPFTQKDIDNTTMAMRVAFQVAIVFLMFMSFFIIYSSFKIITMERLPVIGTFRSVGATKVSTAWLFIMESMVLGLVGGFFGSCMGIGVNKIICNMVTEGWNLSGDKEIRINVAGILIILALSVILSVISSIIPVLRTTRLSLKGLILGESVTKIKSHKVKYIIGVILLVVSIIIPVFAGRKLQAATSLAGIGGVYASLFLLTPVIVRIIAKILSRVIRRIFGNEGYISMKNLIGNRNIINNIILLTIGLASLLLINLSCKSAVNVLTDIYNHRFDDIMVVDEKVDDSFIEELLTVEGVDNAYGLVEEHNIPIEGLEYTIQAVQGGDNENFLSFRDVGISASEDKRILDKLVTGDYIVLTNHIRNQLDLKVGDRITLSWTQGDKEYEIIGFTSTALFSGSYALLPREVIKRDAGTKYYYRSYVSITDDEEVVIDRLTRYFRYRDTNPQYYSTSKQKNDAYKAYNSVFVVMDIFYVLAVLIGLVGIINNLIISFITRKHDMGIYRSIGMSNVQNIKILFLEATFGGVAGGLLGIGFGILLCFNMERLLISTALPIHMSYDIGFMSVILIGGIVVNVIASIVPVIKNYKVNIMQSLRVD